LLRAGARPGTEQTWLGAPGSAIARGAAPRRMKVVDGQVLYETATFQGKMVFQENATGGSGSGRASRRSAGAR